MLFRTVIINDIWDLIMKKLILLLVQEIMSIPMCITFNEFNEYCLCYGGYIIRSSTTSIVPHIWKIEILSYLKDRLPSLISGYSKPLDQLMNKFSKQLQPSFMVMSTVGWIKRDGTMTDEQTIAEYRRLRLEN
jgi:hypothetical protein